MLDIKFIRENADLVERSAKDKGYDVSVAELLSLDSKRRELTTQIDGLREQRNSIAYQMKGGKPSSELVEQGKDIKAKISNLETQFGNIDVKFTTLLNSIPNVFSEDTPVGEESEFTVRSEWGERKTEATDHLDFANNKDWVDFERGAKVAGNKFYYLKGDLAKLQTALLAYGIEKISEGGFTFMDIPYAVKEHISSGTGFTPRSDKQSDTYFIEGEDLSLIGTAEVSLTGYHADEIIDEKDLPLLYAGYSPCFRKEAGAAGKHNRGLFRVHQFNKLEMYAFSTPEQSIKIHEKIRDIEESIWKDLGIPYRVINIPSGDLGAPAWKKYDIEYWSPVDQAYRELTSCSNCTDFQARSLNIRVRRNNGKIEILHTLNGTAISMARTLVAIIENFQDGDKIQVPEVLQKYMSNKKEI
jgi:seryl-tRNA synthetase